MPSASHATAQLVSQNKVLCPLLGFAQAGGELEQIQFLLGHISIQTTERYFGCKQRFRDAVNDHIGLEPDAPS